MPVEVQCDLSVLLGPSSLLFTCEHLVIDLVDAAQSSISVAEEDGYGKTEEPTSKETKRIYLRGSFRLLQEYL